MNEGLVILTIIFIFIHRYDITFVEKWMSYLEENRIEKYEIGFTEEIREFLQRHFYCMLK